MSENGLRNDLRVSEEASGYFRLVEAGWKIRDLAWATGRSAKHVAARLALLQLPAAVRTKVDDGQIGVGEAAELLKLRHHPELLAEVAQALVVDELDDVGWAVRQALGQVERKARRAAVVAELKRAGRGRDRARRLRRASGPERARRLPGTRPGRRGACLGGVPPRRRDPRRRVSPGLRRARPPRQEGAERAQGPQAHLGALEYEAAQRAEHKAVRESAQARAEFLRELLSRRLSKGSVIALVLGAFIRSGNQLPAKAACDLLGLEAPPARDGYYGTRAVEQLMRYPEAGDAHLQRAALALAFALAEEHMGGFGGRVSELVS